MQPSAARKAFTGHLVRRDFIPEDVGPAHPWQPLSAGWLRSQGWGDSIRTRLSDFHFPFYKQASSVRQCLLCNS